MVDANGETKGEKAESRRNRIPTAVLIAWVPVVGYVTAFGYSYGSTYYWGIPQSLIVINFTSVSIAIVSIALAVIAIGAVVFVMGGIRHWLVSRLLKRITRIQDAILTGVLSLPLLAVMMYFTAGWMRWVAFGGILLGIVLYAVLTALNPLEGKQGYDERFFRFLTTGIVALAYVTLLFMTMSFLLGYSQAKTKDTFTVLNTTPESVAIWQYGDHMVCAYFNRETKEIEKSRFILSLACGPEVTMRTEKVGPLHPKKD